MAPVQGHYSDRAGLLVATQRRVIFVDKGWASLRVEDFPYANITSIQYSTGMVFGEIIIFASGNKAGITQLAKAETVAFADLARNQINQLSAPSPLSQRPREFSIPLNNGWLCWSAWPCSGSWALLPMMNSRHRRGKSWQCHDDR